MRLFFCLSILIAILISSQPAAAEKRVALVIGNSAYEHVGRLANPANDAKSVGATLKDAGFDVVDERSDLKTADMRRALRDFSNAASDADIAVIYYAGHGMELDGSNYLIPIDAVLERDIDVYDEAFALERVLATIEPARQLRLIILDACRDNPFAKTMKRTIGSRAIGRGLAKVEPASPNTLIAFASKAGSVASDGDNGHSPFTEALVKYVAKPGLDLRKAFGFIRDDVLKRTGNSQEPFVYGSLGGNDLPLVPAPSQATAAPSNPSADIRKDYELALQLGTKDGWNAFLAQYPDGFYASLARGQLNKIASDETRAAAAEKAHIAAERANQDAVDKDKPDVAPPAQPVQQQSASLERPAPKQDLSPAALTRSVQAELQRVGCFAGSIDGEWSGALRRAMEAFNKNAGTGLETKLASLDAIDAIKARSARVCPLMCDHGYKADGDTCAKITCKGGFELSDDNSCERIAKKKPIAESRRPARPHGNCFSYGGKSYC